MRHVLSALVMNQPGVLAHISQMLASRAFNIDSLAVGATENPSFSRITFVVNGNDRVLDQVRKQLEKIVTVVKVLDFSAKDYVERDLMLITVSATQAQRTELYLLVEMFRGRVCRTMRRGETIFQDGRIAARSCGRLLKGGACFSLPTGR